MLQLSGRRGGVRGATDGDDPNVGQEREGCVIQEIEWLDKVENRCVLAALFKLRRHAGVNFGALAQSPAWAWTCG